MSSEGGCVRGLLKCLNDLWNWTLLHKLYVIVIALITTFFLYLFGYFVPGPVPIISLVDLTDDLFFGWCFGLLCVFLLGGFLLAVIFGSRISTRMAFLLPVISFGIAACVNVVLNGFSVEFFTCSSPIKYFLCFVCVLVLCFVLGKKLGDGVNYILARFLHRGGV